MSQTGDSKQACAETFNHDHKTCKQEALKKRKSYVWREARN